LASFSITSSSSSAPVAEVSLKHKNKIITKSSSGDGPVDACYKAIDKLTCAKMKLLEYHLDAVTSGKDALGEASVKIKLDSGIINGRGSSTDVIEASIKAYLNAINKSRRF